MSRSYLQIKIKNRSTGAVKDPDSQEVLLSDPTGTYGVKRNDTDATVVADATAMTRVSEGVYKYVDASTSLDGWLDPASGLTYTAYLEYAIDGHTTRVPVTVAGTPSSRGTKMWTRASLAEQLQGELPKARNAAGGSVPDRLANIIYESFGFLWEYHDWVFRRRVMSITLASGEETWAPTDDDYTDFEKVDHNAPPETSGDRPLEITNDVARFQAVRSAWLNAERTVQSGEPEIALIEPDTSQSTYRVQFRFAPKADGVYVYRVYYIATAPALGTTEVPKWPTSMFRLWHLDSKWRAQQAFYPGRDTWKSTYRHLAGRLEHAKSQNDEHMRTSTPRLHDGYGDLAYVLAMQDLAGTPVFTNW